MIVSSLNAGGDGVPHAKMDTATLRELAMSACMSANIPPQHASLQIDLLMEAELRGRASHGLMRLPRIIERIANRVLDPTATGNHAWRGSLLEVDGQAGLGPVVAMNALEAMTDRAAARGVCAAAIRNNNHLGMLAWYAERVATSGKILIAMSTSEALVHPWGGRRAMLGTNPIAIGVPTAKGPFVLDMATSLVAMGVIHDHANRGVPLQQGWALDENGDPTVDPERAKDGSLAPFGDAKGYALGLAIELFVTAMTGAAIGRDVQGTLDSDRTCNKGDVFIVLEPPRDGGLPSMLSDFLDEVRHSGTAQPVLVPGDRALASRNAALAKGLSIPTALRDQLTALTRKGTVQ